MKIFKTVILVSVLLTLAVSNGSAQDLDFYMEGLSDDLLGEDDYAFDGGVWNDEFEDGRPSDGWYVYDPEYFVNYNAETESYNRAQRRPLLPHEEATIYDDPINAREIEGLLELRGVRREREAPVVFDPANLSLYKVICPDPMRGPFRARLRIALRGRSFQTGTVLFFCREHDWRFDGAREARVAINFASPTAIRYGANFYQKEFFNINVDRSDELPIEDSVVVELRRVEGKNRIEYYTSEDESPLRFRGELGPAIESDLVDLLIGVQFLGPLDPATGMTEGSVTIDSFSIRGPEIPDVDEGSSANSDLAAYHELVIQQYDDDVRGRFAYDNPSAIMANRAFTWMHYMGTMQMYPKELLPSANLVQTDPRSGRGQPAPDLTDAQRHKGALDQQTFPRGSREYLDAAYEEYRLAAAQDSNYSPIARQVGWLYEVAWDRLVSLLYTFRARTGDVRLTGILNPDGTAKEYISEVGKPTSRDIYDPIIHFYEGTLPPDIKAQIQGRYTSYDQALTLLNNYFGPGAEIVEPIDLMSRIPFLFDDEWMTVNLTVFVPDIVLMVLRNEAMRENTLRSQVERSALVNSIMDSPLNSLERMGTRAGYYQMVNYGYQQLPSNFSGSYQEPNLGRVNEDSFAQEETTLRAQYGRGYTVVEYYGGKFEDARQVVRDEFGSIQPRETAERSFAYLKDFPGFLDIVTEVLDPSKRGNVVLNWKFNFAELATIVGVPDRVRPREIRAEGGLQPPQNLYDEDQIEVLVGTRPDLPPRRFTFADYFGWDVGGSGGYEPRNPEGPNHLAAFDSPHYQDIPKTLQTGDQFGWGQEFGQTAPGQQRPGMPTMPMGMPGMGFPPGGGAMGGRPNY